MFSDCPCRIRFARSDTHIIDAKEGKKEAENSKLYINLCEMCISAFEHSSIHQMRAGNI